MAISKRKYSFVDFSQEPYAGQWAKTTYAVATGANDQEDFFKAQNGTYFEWIQTGQNDAIFFQPAAAAPLGWVIPCDKTDTDGVEITQGIVSGAVGTTSFTIGTDPAFFVRATLNVPTLANQDVVCVGFRRLAAYGNITSPATLNAYTDSAWLGIYTDAGAFGSNTELNNAGLVTTAATHIAAVATEWMDLTVKVSAAGAVTYLIGTGATVAAAKTASAADVALGLVSMTFDSTDIVVPSIAFVHTGAGAASTVVLGEYECGHQ
jgi:hypothetical protein